MGNISDKQATFVTEYLKDLNATQAAIRAGYSAKTAKQQGARLLTNADILAAVVTAKADRGERTRIDADWVLTRLAEEADADLADLYDDGGNLLPVKQWPIIWRKGLVAGVETVSERVGEDRNGKPEFATIHKIKLSDRIKRIELIGKHVDVQAFKEKVEHTGAMTLVIASEDADL